MPKPILSELEYNASDVASAILASADLSVTNQDFGVTDQSDEFTILNSFYANYPIKAFQFNGFMFMQIGITRTTSPDSNTAIISIDESDLVPNYNVVCNSISYQGESASEIYITADEANIYVGSVNNEGDDYFRIICNFMYRLP